MTFEPRPYDLFPPPAPAATGTTGRRSSLAIALASAHAWLAGFCERRRQRKMLGMLDDRRLADLGLTRADVASETAKWSWQH
jgi:uncharacterized protein YjiS (DUF1127 family)